MYRAIFGIALILLSQLSQAQDVAPDFKSLRLSLDPIPVEDVERANRGKNLANCFWAGTVSPQTHNILFPDKGVMYWATQFRLPEGAKLVLDGQFPHARHMSFSSYVQGTPVDRINDLLIPPVVGASNPFIPGARRDTEQRAYRVNVVERPFTASQPMDDAQRAPGDLYVPKGKTPHQLYYRVYVPDEGRDVRGGVSLPEPHLTLADGKTLSGAQLCQAIVEPQGLLNDVHLAADKLKPFYNLSKASSPYHPAQPQPYWNAFFNPLLSASALLLGTPFEGMRAQMDVTRRGGYFSTLDNTYMSTYIDKRFGDVLVLQAKAPTTPQTLAGSAVMQSAQLRYWSLCKYRSLSDTAVDSCLYDEQVPTDKAGEYTIVISSAAKRPINAKAECGVAWMDWGSVGDGIGNPDGGFLLFRHMMPAADFKQSLFDTKKLGDEASVLGEYFPDSRYLSKAQFEQRGCDI